MKLLTLNYIHPKGFIRIFRYHHSKIEIKENCLRKVPAKYVILSQIQIFEKTLTFLQKVSVVSVKKQVYLTQHINVQKCVWNIQNNYRRFLHVLHLEYYSSQAQNFFMQHTIKIVFVSTIRIRRPDSNRWRTSTLWGFKGHARIQMENTNTAKPSFFFGLQT